MESEPSKCDSVDCTSVGHLKCGTCKKLGLSKAFGHYCSGDCQKLCFASHKNFHKIPVGDALYLSGVAWTALLALRELQVKGCLPALDNEKCFQLHLFGCRTNYEGNLNQYPILLDLLKRSGVYTDIKRLEVTISGIEMQQPFQPLVTFPNVIVRQIQGSCQTIAPTLDFTCGVAMLCNSGINQHHDSWAPAIKCLLKLNCVVITTGHSTDEPYDQKTFETYFAVNIVLPSTKNAAAFVADIPGHGPVGYNGFYLAFQGRKEGLEPISKHELIKSLNLVYLAEYGAKYSDPAYCQYSPMKSERYNKLRIQLENGTFPLSETCSRQDIINFVAYGAN